MTAITFNKGLTALTPTVTVMVTLATSSTLLAGAQSDAVDIKTDDAFEYMVRFAVTGNAGSNMTAGAVIQLFSSFSEDSGSTYEGGGEVTGAGQAAKTLTESGKGQLTLMGSWRWEAAISQVISAVVPLLAGRPGRLTTPDRVVFWATHNGGQALSAAAITVYPRNLD